MNTSCVSSNVLAPKMPVRVVCRFRDTAATFEPMSELRSWDFPAFGAPTRATSSRLRSGVDFVSDETVDGSSSTRSTEEWMVWHIEGGNVQLFGIDKNGLDEIRCIATLR